MIDLAGLKTTHPDLLPTHHLLDAGYDDKAITRLSRDGRLHRIRHGYYAWGYRWREMTLFERRRLTALADLYASRSATVLSHTTAAEMLDAPVWGLPEVTHLTRVDHRAGRRAVTRAQHRGLVYAEDITIRDGIPLTSGTRTAFDVMTIADIERSLIVINGLLHSGDTTMPLLQRFAPRAESWPDSVHHRIVLRLADGRCESAGESRTLYLCWSQHLPAPTPQFLIKTATGRIVARVDFAWPELGVFLEFDGLIKYRRLLKKGESASDAVIREKRREELICGITGWRCIRLTWADLAQPERTAARIRAVLAGQRWAA